MNKLSIGVIGIGRMGAPMATNLIREGYDVYIYDVNKEAMEAVVESGAKAMGSPAQVAEACSVLILSLLQPKVIEQVLFSSDGICSINIQDKVIIDTSTCVPSLAREWGIKIKKLGGQLLDAPVTGGVWGAQHGTLTFMVGGERSGFERCMEVFNVIGKNIVYIGDSGAGQTAKMANQMIMASYYATIAETFAYVEKLGVSVDKVLDAVETGGGESKVLSGFAHEYRKDQAREKTGEAALTDSHYSFVFKKDLFCALQDGFEHNCHMPMTAAAHEVLKQTLSSDTKGEWPIRVLNMWRKCFNGGKE
jgi:3-hydroxyisobutyrate dehydrogenase-like beta-hydroxyacid dehydrogenase